MRRRSRQRRGASRFSFRKQTGRTSDLRFRRRVESLHALGPQAVGRFLAEIGAERSIRTPIDQKLESYAALSPRIVAELGAADWPPDPKTVIET